MVYRRSTKVSAYSVRKIASKRLESKPLPKKKVLLKKKEIVSKAKPNKVNKKAKKKKQQQQKPKYEEANEKEETRIMTRSASSSAEDSTDKEKPESRSSPNKEKPESRSSSSKERHEKALPGRSHKRQKETPPDIPIPVKESSSSSSSAQRAKKGRYSEIEDLVSEKSESDITDSDNASNGEKCFKWLINPITPETFFSTVWEKKPLLVRRHNPDYYKGLFSCNEFDRILRKKEVWFSKNIDITTYNGGVRETHNPDGRAYSDVVWDYFQGGCSVRFLNPQTYSSNVWQLNSMLQEIFGSFVGANVYLTPALSQGFAPHYDDIEAFVLQIEGKKQWRLYNPRTPDERLPRYSSANFTQEEIGEPILTTVLEPGDLLYFPRGIIHQARTLEEDDSLHITLSTFQRNSWGDYFAKLIPRALEIAIDEDIEFRKSLPVGYLQYMGVSKIEVANTEAQNNKGEDRANFIKKASELTTKLIQYLPLDAASDQMAKDFLHESLPPWLMPYEKTCSIHRSDETVFKTKPCWMPEKRVRIIRPTAVRLVMEESIKLYHSVENTRQYHEIEPQYIVIDEEYVIAVEQLINDYPKFTAIEDLPLDTFKQKVDLATKLYERGLLVTEDTDVPVGVTCF